jgi:hypothetical protein
MELAPSLPFPIGSEPRQLVTLHVESSVSWPSRSPPSLVGRELYRFSVLNLLLFPVKERLRREKEKEKNENYKKKKKSTQG